MNGNGELTETENVILRKLRSSYGILTDERNSYVLCYGNGYGNGYGTLETRRNSDRDTHDELITTSQHRTTKLGWLTELSSYMYIRPYIYVSTVSRSQTGYQRLILFLVEQKLIPHLDFLNILSQRLDFV